MSTALVYSGDRAASYVPAAQSCVYQAGECLDLLDSSLMELEAGTRDMQRLAKVMHNTRLYVLIDEPSLRQIKSEISDAIEPQIEKLVSQGEKAIANLEKTQSTLERKAEGLRTRASMPVTADPHAGAPLQVRNEIRKTKLLMKQEKMLEQELSTLQKEIDDLELQILTFGESQRSRKPPLKSAKR